MRSKTKTAIESLEQARDLAKQPGEEFHGAVDYDYLIRENADAFIAIARAASRFLDLYDERRASSDTDEAGENLETALARLKAA